MHEHDLPLWDISGGLDHVGRVIRPPAEAGSILLQVTLGCSHNACAFCPAYKDKPFAIKPPERVSADLDFAARHMQDTRRLFLCDGDALVLPQKRLEELLAEIRAKLPWIARVSSYASAKSLAGKTAEELARLRGLGLSTVSLGLESGDEETLAAMNKWGSVAEHLEQAAKAKTAGLRLAVTVLLGLGGKARAEEHARATGEALSRMDPHQASALALMVVRGTPLFERVRQGAFLPQDDAGLLRELFTLLTHLELSGGLFLANHASNPLRLKLRLPKDKPAGLAQIDNALHGGEPLVPQSHRRL